MSILDLVDDLGLEAVLESVPSEDRPGVVALFEEELYRFGCDVEACDGQPHEGKPLPHARANQLPPDGDWLLWLILAGRGWGKTRTGGEFVKDGHPQALLRLPGCRAALVAETFADGRDTMVEGESGLLSILPPSALKGGTIESAWNRSMGELFLENGSKAKVFSSEKPGQLRGPQHHIVWGDEPAKWKDAVLGDAEDTTFSNIMLGLRLGQDPRLILTGTPKRVKLLVGTKDRPGILKQDTTHLTSGTTYENLGNLAPTFRARVLSKYEGTRLGLQEFHARVLEDVEGALWSTDMIDRHRVHPESIDSPGKASDMPAELAALMVVSGLLRPVDSSRTQLVRVVTAVDPAVTSGPDSDECGIVVAGLADNGHVYVLADRSLKASPEGWASAAIRAHHDFGGDHVTAEVNQGGDLVTGVLSNVDHRVRVMKVHASRGKVARAEPVVALYEQGKVHHVGVFPDLEDELTGWDPNSSVSPNRLDALVWAISDLSLNECRPVTSSTYRVVVGRR